MKINVNNLIVSLSKNQDKEIMRQLKEKKIEANNIKSIKWNKRSIDSRKKNDIKFIYNLEVELKTPIDVDKVKDVTKVKEKKKVERVPLLKNKEVAVIGAGPAGLFAALRLAEYGYIPYVFERGEDVEHRDATTDTFIKKSILNPDSNIQFGEGGAGTYSDGKLNTRIKSEYIEKVFNEFVECGAQGQILWDYKPHIGTDILKVVVKNLREKIKTLGGKFFFNHRLENIVIKDGKISQIEVINDKGIKTSYAFDSVILAIGNSARDT